MAFDTGWCTVISCFISLVVFTKLSIANTDVPVVISSVVPYAVTDLSHTHSSCGEYAVHLVIYGDGLTDDVQVAITSSSNQCEPTLSTCAIVNATSSDKAHALLWVDPNIQNRQLYLCVQNVTKRTAKRESPGVNKTTSANWLHQGDDSRFEVLPSLPLVAGRPSLPAAQKLEPFITAMRVEEADKGVTYDSSGLSVVLAGSDVLLRIYGPRLTNDVRIKFTTEVSDVGDSCEEATTRSFEVVSIDQTSHSSVVKVQLPHVGNVVYYLCVQDAKENKWVHQGSSDTLALKTYEKLLPMWLQCMLIILLLVLSGLFSGLNLGLMALDRTELKIVSNTGSDKEQKYARAIEPVRRHGNYLLCSLLLGNVLVNSTLTIMLDDLTSGIVAVVGATMGIVIFGEIIPQAICSRHGLAVGARTVYVTKFFMILTFPLSYPISLILDKLLGEEIGNVYNRKRLKELIEVTRDYHDLEKDEVNIISGALELKEKAVGEIMTKLDDVYMLAVDTCLDFETVSEIMQQGYSRIPIYEGLRSSIVGLLHIKNLAFVDPDDNMPLRSLIQFYNNPYFFVFEDTTLDCVFKEFKEGDKGHMAFVQQVNSEGEGDPFYETIGLVTLEDVIEELIQSEIIDETDVWVDNQQKCKRNFANTRTDFTCFAEMKSNRTVQVSPQLIFATFQYLSTAVPPFASEFITEGVLRKLLNMNVVHHIRVKSRELARDDPHALIYEQGKAADFFAMVIEGRIEVNVGREKLLFETGPFTYFGTLLLATIGSQSPSTPSQSTRGSIGTSEPQKVLFVPDYTVRAVSEVYYLRISYSLYQAALQASVLAKAQKDNKTVDQMEREIEKYFQGFDCTNDFVFGSEFSRVTANDMHKSVSRRSSIMKARSSLANDITASPMGRKMSRSEDERHLMPTASETANEANEDTKLLDQPNQLDNDSKS